MSDIIELESLKPGGRSQSRSLKCLNVKKRPISRLVLINDIFSYKLSNLVNVGPILTDS